MLLYGRNWKFSNDDNNKLETNRHEDYGCINNHLNYIHHDTLLMKADEALAKLISKNGNNSNDMLEIEKFKIFNVEMHYDNSTATNIVSEEIINSYSLTESPFILNKLADKKIHDKSYRALSPAEKILVLSWLCDTLLNSSRVRDQMSEEHKSSQVSFVNRKECGQPSDKEKNEKRTRISDNAEEEDIKVRKR